MTDRPVADQLIQYINERRTLGVCRYGRPLVAGNGRTARHDALAEIMDFALYYAQDLIEQDGGLPPGDDEDPDKLGDHLAQQLAERHGIEKALRNLLGGLEARREFHLRISAHAAAEENQVTIDALQGILDNPTAALETEDTGDDPAH